MATRYQFVDDSGETRLAGFLVPEPGGGNSFPTGINAGASDEFTVDAAGATNIYPSAGDALHVGNTSGNDRLIVSDTGVQIGPQGVGHGIALDDDGHIGFFGVNPQAQPTGVAVSAAGIHAALVTLGLITA